MARETKFTSLSLSFFLFSPSSVFVLRYNVTPEGGGGRRRGRSLCAAAPSEAAEAAVVVAGNDGFPSLYEDPSLLPPSPSPQKELSETRKRRRNYVREYNIVCVHRHLTILVHRESA